MDELKSRFDEATDGIVPPPPDVSRVTTRGRKRQRLYLVGAAVGVAMVLLLCVFGVSILLGANGSEIAGSRDPNEQVFEWRETRFVDTPDEGGLEVEAKPVWRGSIPPPAGLVLLCHVELTNSAGDVVYEGRNIELQPPKAEERRSGTIATFGTPGADPGLRAQDLTPKIECVQRSQEPQPTPPSPPEDQAAGEVVEHLRTQLKVCAGFDFHFRDEIEGKAYRPVQCGAETEITKDGRPAEAPETPGPIEGDDLETRYLSGPDLLVYGFGDRAARDAWLATQQPGLGGRVYGEDWVIDVIDADLYRRIASGPPRGAEEAIAPKDEVIYGDHSLEAVATSRRSKASLPEAIETARDKEELLIAEPVLYRHQDAKGSRAWHVVLRRCVPSYGGTHADAGCQGEQTHIVIDVRSGAVLAEFIT